MKGKFIFTESVGYLTTTISRKLQQRLIARFNGTGLNATPEQWRVLVTLHNEGKMYQSQLAEFHKKDRAGIKRLVDHLEDNNLVIRESSQKDARTNTVSITQEGTSIVETLNTVSKETLDEALDCFTESEVTIIKMLLNKLLDNIQ